MLVLLSGWGARTAWAGARAADAEGIDFFEKRVRPLLADRCYRCHSDRATKLRGGLRLDTREGLLKGGNSGPAVVPGDPDRSLLIRAVRHADPDLKMPPNNRLPAEEVATLEAWVKRGAPVPDTGRATESSTRTHWAFLPPKAQAPPRVKQQGWAQGPIDHFLLARLEEKELRPVPPADRPTLLRRATFDLTGLPPSPDELDAFLADNSPDAFAKVVDRLLASPAYGERWGRHWLDLARYCDDFPEAWRYRDWVVHSFNRDLPYDQFVALQIAGDRLPAPSPLPSAPGGEGKGEGGSGAVNADGVVATTLLSLGPWGGIDRGKRMADIVDDQIDTIGRGFLGLTLACARCHDHKFDPITQEDYYALAGIFYSSRVLSDTGYLSHGTHRLRIPLVSPEEIARHQRHLARIQVAEKQLQDEVERHYSAFAASLLPRTAAYLQAAWEYRLRPKDQAALSVRDFASRRGLHPFALEQWVSYLGGTRLAEGRRLHVPVRDYDGERGVHVWGASAERPWWGVNTNKHEVAIETFLLPPRTVSVNPGTEGGAVGWKSPISGRVRVTGRLVDADPHDGVGVSWAVDLVSGGVRRELSSGSLPNGGTLGLDQGRQARRLASVEVKAGDVLYLNVWLRQGDAHYDITNVDLTVTRLDGPGTWDLTRDVIDHFLDGNPNKGGPAAGVWSFHDLAGSGRKDRMPATDRALAALDPVIAEVAAGKRDRAALAWAGRTFQTMIDVAGTDSPLVQDLTTVSSPFWVRERDDAKYLPANARAALARQATDLEALRNRLPPLPCAHGVEEGGPRFSLFPGTGDVRVHVRGRHEQLGARAPRRFPRALAGDRPPAITAGSGRLELARWVGSADNPLTARVMVNRIWQHHFGEGIVRTPSNFGRLGTPPTHPELLDWLAVRFVESGWSVKAMHRLILLSAAYQQSSRPSPDLLRADPDNRLFGRMNRRRLEAEALHDGLLAICGRLDRSRGGPPGVRVPEAPCRMVYLKSSRADRSGFG
ncbi:MAG TPA: PSD1 and planctomycete cytochrome C domain-containing protein, partial [Gemmataceae bacterium]|nr:PSD1 and planctomycete cytochrome C domain-containing protein [Gemmataceae bacterium]